MKNWKKTALKSARSPKVETAEEKQAEDIKVDHDLSEAEEGDPLDDFLREFAAYTNHRLREECEAIQREMADVEVPPGMLKRLDKMAEAKEKEMLVLKKRRRMRRCVTSVACVFLLFFAVGTGIFISPQSEHLKSELYELLMGSEDREEAAYSGGTDFRDSEEDAVTEVSEGEEGMSKDGEQYADKNRQIGQSGGTSGKTPSVSQQTGKENSDKNDSSQGNNSSGQFQPAPGDSSESESPSGGGSGAGNPGAIENGSGFPQAFDRVYYPDYLPDGYQRTYVSAGDCVEIIFENSETGNLLTLQYYPKGFDFYEAAAEDGKRISINGSKAVLYYRNPLDMGTGQTVLYWNREAASIRIQCPAGSLSDGELLRVARSVALKRTDHIS